MARIAGTKNKNKDRLLRQIQAEFPNYNALVELLKIASYSETSTSEKISCHTTVAKYLYPQLKAVEHSGDADPVIYRSIIKRFDGSVDKEGVSALKVCQD